MSKHWEDKQALESELSKYLTRAETQKQHSVDSKVVGELAFGTAGHFQTNSITQYPHCSCVCVTRDTASVQKLGMCARAQYVR